MIDVDWWTLKHQPTSPGCGFKHDEILRGNYIHPGQLHTTASVGPCYLLDSVDWSSVNAILKTATCKKHFLWPHRISAMGGWVGGWGEPFIGKPFLCWRCQKKMCACSCVNMNTYMSIKCNVSIAMPLSICLSDVGICGIWIQALCHTNGSSMPDP